MFQHDLCPRLPPELGAPALKAGGLAIYFRHAETDQTGPTDEAADLTHCESQRNPSAIGREQAKQMGRSIAALGNKIGPVTTSPFCRCQDTDKLAFGRNVVSDDLFFSVKANAEQTKRLADGLRQMLSTPPPPGTNAVIVSHTTNLREAIGIWLKPEGVAYIFQPLPEGRLRALARVFPQDWAATAKRK